MTANPFRQLRKFERGIEFPKQNSKNYCPWLKRI
jgi:hypothetical protein